MIYAFMTDGPWLAVRAHSLAEAVLLVRSFHDIMIGGVAVVDDESVTHVEIWGELPEDFWGDDDYPENQLILRHEDGIIYWENKSGETTMVR